MVQGIALFQWPLVAIDPVIPVVAQYRPEERRGLSIGALTERFQRKRSMGNLCLKRASSGFGMRIPQLHFIGTDESAVASHEPDVVAQSRHESSAEGVAVDRRKRWHREGD